MATDHALLSSRQQKAWYVPAFKSPGKEVVPIHPGGKVIAVKKLLLSATQFLFDRTPQDVLQSLIAQNRDSQGLMSLGIRLRPRGGFVFQTRSERERERNFVRKYVYVEKMKRQLQRWRNFKFLLRMLVRFRLPSCQFQVRIENYDPGNFLSGRKINGV